MQATKSAVQLHYIYVLYTFQAAGGASIYLGEPVDL